MVRLSPEVRGGSRRSLYEISTHLTISRPDRRASRGPPTAGYGTTRQAAAADLLLAHLPAAFFGAAFMTALRPRPREFVKSDPLCASAASGRFQ